MIVLLILLNVRFIATPRFTPWNNCSGGGCNCNREMWRQHRRLWSWIVRWLNSVGLGVFFDSTEGDFIHWAVLKHMKLNVSDNLSAKMQLVCRLLQRVGQPGSGCSSLSTLFILPLHWTPFLFFFLGVRLSIFQSSPWKTESSNTKSDAKPWSYQTSEFLAWTPMAKRPGRRLNDPTSCGLNQIQWFLLRSGQSSNQRTSTY